MTSLLNTDTEIKEPAVSWKTHNNVKYLSVNFKGLDCMEMLDTVKKMKELMSSQPDNSIRFYLNTKNAKLSFSTVMMLRKFSSSMQSKILKSGFSGVKGTILPLFNMYKSFTDTKALLFKSKKEAIEYVCS